MYITLQEWGELFESTADSAKRERKTRKDREHIKINLGETAIRLIDSIITNLNELRSELQETD
ncbi:hypothetical protein ACFLVM_00490 [Chloroflexota bacterium]